MTLEELREIEAEATVLEHKDDLKSLTRLIVLLCKVQQPTPEQARIIFQVMISNMLCEPHLVVEGNKAQ